MRAEELSIRRFIGTILVFLAIFGVVMVVCPLIGSERISLSRALDKTIPRSENPDAVIFFHTRLPRCLLAAIVGAALAAAGVTFQAMLKNPLATPYTLGLSGGCSLAAVLVILFFGSLSIRFSYLQPLASFLGALATLGLVYRLGRSRGKAGSIHPVTLILAGVTLNLLFGSIILLLQYIADPAQTFFLLHWLMGNLDIASYSPVLILVPFQVIGLFILVIHGRQMNLLSLDEMSARSLGLDVTRVTRRLYFASSLVAGTAISFSGPIGFVGLIVPHAIRLVLGADHRLLLPSSLLAGGAFLVICDTLARTVLAPTELPVGVITALLGGPFFLWLLRTRGKGGVIT